MLAGPNGSGKSSFFDALARWQRDRWEGARSDDYHLKWYTRTRAARQPSGYEIDVTLYSPAIPSADHGLTPDDERLLKKLLYFRSAYRNDPEYQSRRLEQRPDPLDDSRIDRMIDNDVAIGKNYQQIASRVFDIFDISPQMTDKFTESLISPIREPVKKLFPHLTFNGLANPLRDGTFRFTKGASKGFHFKNLSGGEKAAFDLILDLVVAVRSYDNTLFCIDEPESHMNARLQAELLTVLYGMIPDNCQLMLATHSIGMMRRARDIEAEQPGSVIFLDFDGRDFDQIEVIDPAVPDTNFWNNAYDVALDDLAALVAPERVVICEGEPRNRSTRRNYAHDARCYDSIFESEFPETRFIPGGNSTEALDDRRGIAYALGVLISGIEVVRLIDRDAHSDDEVRELNQKGIRVLSRRNLESYLFDDEILRALAASVDQQDKAGELLAEKKRIVANRSNEPSDDFKPASGEIYNACKALLNLTNPGNDARTFMRDTLTPLVGRDSQVYEKMRQDIFG